MARRDVLLNKQASVRLDWTGMLRFKGRNRASGQTCMQQELELLVYEAKTGSLLASTCRILIVSKAKLYQVSECKWTLP